MAAMAAKPKMVGNSTPAACKGPGAERGDAVAELVERDHAARDGGRDAGQVFLPEADGEGQ